MSYIIMGRSKYGTEEIDEAETRDDAEYLVREYRMAYGPGWTIWAKRQRETRENPRLRRGQLMGIYDSGPEYGDRYTAVFNDPDVNRATGLIRYPAIAFGENPYHPQGFGQHVEIALNSLPSHEGFGQHVEIGVPGAYLGKKISLNSLPSQAKKFVMEEKASYEQAYGRSKRR